MKLAVEIFHISNPCSVKREESTGNWKRDIVKKNKKAQPNDKEGLKQIRYRQ